MSWDLSVQTLRDLVGYVQNGDSMTHFSVGDEVVVYFDGNIAESYPMQITTVYAITLRTPADRTGENRP